MPPKISRRKVLLMFDAWYSPLFEGFPDEVDAGDYEDFILGLLSLRPLSSVDAGLVAWWKNYKEVYLNDWAPDRVLLRPVLRDPPYMSMTSAAQFQFDLGPLYSAVEESYFEDYDARASLKEAFGRGSSVFRSPSPSLSPVSLAGPTLVWVRQTCGRLCRL